MMRLFKSWKSGEAKKGKHAVAKVKKDSVSQKVVPETDNDAGAVPDVLERTEESSVLAEIAKDKSLAPELRQEALERVEDQALLYRVVCDADDPANVIAADLIGDMYRRKLFYDKGLPLSVRAVLVRHLEESLLLNIAKDVKEEIMIRRKAVSHMISQHTLLEVAKSDLDSEVRAVAVLLRMGEGKFLEKPLSEEYDTSFYVIKEICKYPDVMGNTVNESGETVLSEAAMTYLQKVSAEGSNLRVRTLAQESSLYHCKEGHIGPFKEEEKGKKCLFCRGYVGETEKTGF